MPADRPAAVAPSAKQIVFLFMAATVVAVVVFLCGVLVGRGGPTVGAAGADTGRPGDLSDLPPPILTTPRSEPSAGAFSSGDLTYPERLASGPTTAPPPGVAEVTSAEVGTPTEDEESGPSMFEEVAPASPPPAPVRAAEPPPARVADAPPAPVAVADAAGAIAVQVFASSAEGPARAVAAQLSERGYPAFVRPPSPDEPVPFYRVRVGPYGSQADAERIRERLEQQEGMSSYVVR